MCPSTSCSLSSLTLNIVLGRASTISPSISIFSSFGKGAAQTSDGPYVDGLGTLVPGLLLVLDLGVLSERLESLPVDPGVVDEQVAVTLIRSDEPVALLVVEPFHGSRRHISVVPSCRAPAPRPNPLRTTALDLHSPAWPALRPGKLPSERGGSPLAALERRLARALLEE